MKTSNDKRALKQWLITGGCGFIGTNLIDKLMKEPSGYKIRVLDNLLVGTRKDLSEVCDFVETDMPDISDRTICPEVELVVGDIKDYETCLKCCKGVDVIVHLAANTGVGPSVKNPRKDMESNIQGTFNMLEAARLNHVKRFIFASSGAPIGECEPPIHEEIAPHPVSPYGASKLAGEGYCSAYFRTFGLETIALRFGNVYGPRSNNKNSVVAKFIKRALDGETLEIYGDGNQTRDFIFVDDLTNAIMLSTQADTGGEVFQIATYRETSVNEIAMAIKALIESVTQQPVKVIHGSARLGDVRRNFSDIAKARDKLGFLPAFDLETGLEATLQYFEKIIM